MAATLDHDKTAAPEAQQAPEPPEAEVPARTCATCSAPLADGQDWCLECGSAQPGRLGGRAGWRAALIVLGVTVLLAGGAVAAAYAALSSEARREAAAPAPPPAAPQVAQPPVQTAPAPATTTPETPTVKAPTPKPTPEPEAPPQPEAPAATPAPSATGDVAGGETPADEPAEPAAIDLPADSATTYDPYKRAGTQAGDPADAVDGKPQTAWQVPVGADGKVRAGLAISLEKAQALSKLEFQAGTPGFTVEVYATRAAQLPPDVLDGRWEHVADRREVGPEEEIELDGKYRHVLLWVTSMPADTIVGIPEVQLFG